MENQINTLSKKHFFKGIVISKKMLLTATVVIERVFKDNRVNKIVRKKTKFHVHDPLNITNIGDEVLFYEGRHISKIKYMHIHSILNQSKSTREIVS
jgi:small subunit ribosomal protein S17